MNHAALKEFRTALGELLTFGSETSLANFLDQSLPSDAAAPFLHGQWPMFNGVITNTPIANHVLTEDVLKNVSKSALNTTLIQALRTACSEGNPHEEGHQLLRRLVACGARMDALKTYVDPLGKDNGRAALQLRTKINAVTGHKPPRLTERLIRPGDVFHYVNRLVAVHAVVHGQTLRGQKPAISASPHARSRALVNKLRTRSTERNQFPGEALQSPLNKPFAPPAPHHQHSIIRLIFVGMRGAMPYSLNQARRSRRS